LLDVVGLGALRAEKLVRSLRGEVEGVLIWWEGGMVVVWVRALSDAPLLDEGWVGSVFGLGCYTSRYLVSFGGVGGVLG